jgi:Cu2+-exporting ATPase
MCCPGCAAISSAIEAAGMGGYYRARSGPADRQSNAPEGGTDSLTRLDALLFDDPGLQQGFVGDAEQGRLREAHLLLRHVRCGACAWLIEGQLGRQAGVASAQVNTLGARLVLRWDPQRTGLSALIIALRQIGYDATPWEPGQADATRRRQTRRRFAELAVAGLGMMQVMMYAVPVYLADAAEITAAQIQLMQWASLALTLPVLLFSAQGIFLGAWRGLRHGQLNMDVPVSAGLLAAFGGSLWSLWRGQGPVWFDSVTMFVFLLLATRWLEHSVRERALAATGQLAHPVPAQALKRLPGVTDSLACAVASLRPGDRIRVPAGEVIPVDGRILLGEGPVEEALLTGESAPVWRRAGERVLAASVNLGQMLEIEVEAVGAGSVLARMLRRMDQALGERAPLARLADRAAGHFVAALLLITAAAGAGWLWYDASRALGVAIAILVVSCPCALALAVPATLAASSARLARAGVLVLQGHTLETLARARTFVFDKTGTLTLGRPTIRVDWLAVPAVRQRHLAAIVLGLEADQPHPLALALTRWARECIPDRPAATLEGLHGTLGQGIEGQLAGRRWRIGRRDFVLAIASSVSNAPQPGLDHAGSGAWLGSEDGLQALFHFDDPLRPGAAELIAALRAEGCGVHILSGDQACAVRSFGARLGIGDARGGLTPEGKLAAVLELARSGPVVMVGDGLNDAPGFGAAHLAIAMGRVSQALARGADAVVPSASLAALQVAIVESRCAFARMRQNLAWALAYNLVAIPLAASGWLTPWEAGLGMSLSSLIVVLNGMRPWKS